MKLKNILQNLTLVIATLVVTAFAGEILLRIKNSDQKNYVVEMWRYAKELKKYTGNSVLGHEQLPFRTVKLQNVEFRTNDLGMRGPPDQTPDEAKNRILILGSSITLGWGVPEQDTIRAKLEGILGDQYQVFNGGVGNYNTVRSVAYFRDRWRSAVRPNTIVLHYFINDAELLPSRSGNFIIRNSQLAVTFYHLFNGLISNSSSLDSLVSHYQNVYELDSTGYQKMVKSLQTLKKMSEEDNFRVVFAMMPDIHQLENYPFKFIHDRMRAIATQMGWKYIDFFDVVKNFKGPELWTIPGDPHPNATVHRLMAEHLAPVIHRKK